MVKIAIAGGTGNVAQEVIDVLVATKKHDILIFSRRNPPSNHRADDSVSYLKTDYSSVEDLTLTLGGTHTVLSFVAPHLDQTEAFIAQRNLIDASVKAGVKRFAPSEWVSAGLDHMPWYSFKADTRQYLEHINKDSKVLEYCLFQPGLFTNYLTHPYKSTNHIKDIETPFDFGGRRMIVCDSEESTKVTFTTVYDLANVVAQAIDYAGEWPVDGGIKGSDLSVGQLVQLGEKIRGPFVVDKVETTLLRAGIWRSSWMPEVDHPSIAPEDVEVASRIITAGILLAMQAGAFHSNDTWNALLPDYKFEDAENFLKRAWYGKP